MVEVEDYCGYFKFKVDTKNPQKDKRKNNIAYMPEWFAGVYVIVTKRNQEDFRIIFTDNSSVDFSSKQMISLHENLEKLPLRLDLLLIKAYFANMDKPENFIEYLLHMGKITLSDLEEVEKILSEHHNETSPNLDESFNASSAIISDRSKYMTSRLQRWLF